MRLTGFGDAYCHTADEARRIIDKSDTKWEVYVGEYSPPEGDFGWTAEILENGSGETVCYIEAETEAIVRAILKELAIR